MKTCHSPIVALGLTSLLACQTSRALEVKLQVADAAGAARKPAVVTSGVPFAKGEVKDVSRLALSAGGKPVPAQFAKTVAWGDGSIRWVLMDTQVEVPAGGQTELVLSDSGGNPAPAAPVGVEDGAEAVKVSTGGLVVVLGKKKPGLFESLKIDGRELLTSSGKGLVIVKVDGGEAVAGAPSEVKVEHAGPMRAVVCLRGKFPGLHKDLLGYTARVSVFAGQKFVKVHLWLENDGAVGFPARDESRKIEWFAFDGMAVDLGLGLGREVAASCEGAEGQGNLKVFQTCRVETLKYGEYRHRTPFTNLEFSVTSKGQELKRGARTDGVVALKGEAGTLTAAVRDFWQNYEKAIELDGDRLRLWLWPVEGQWPRPEYRADKEAGAYKDIFLDKMNVLQGSVHKGHEFILDFSGRPAAETSAELSAPLFALASAERYAGTDALPTLFGPPGVKTGDKECDFKLACWGRMSRSMADPDIPTSIAAVRLNYEYAGKGQGFTRWHGWMDFGDISTLGGQTSGAGNWAWLALLEYLRNGDANSLRLATDMIRHRIDVDQCWSDRDPEPGCRMGRGGQDVKFHVSTRRSPDVGGGHGVAGMALWHLLTGEPKAREACLRTAEGLVVAWEEVAKNKPYGGPQGDMAANCWGIEAFCAVHDLTGEQRWLDEAMKLFNTNVTDRWKKVGPHLYGHVGIVGQGYAQEDKEYLYAIVPLCNLHRRTRDANVLKLLVEGCEKPFEQMHFDAPVFIAGLFAYTGAETGKGEYLKQAAKYFAQGFPESKCPPVALPGNVTWPEKSAMLIRAGYPVNHAFWRQKAGK